MFLSDVAPRSLCGWNEKILGEDVAIEFCRSNSICIVDDYRLDYGRIVFYKGYTFILKNPYLEAGMRLWVLWHEIAHFLLHAPQSSKFSPLVKRKNDREANYIAAIAMMPRQTIQGRTFHEIEEEYGYPAKLIEIRDQIVKNEGI